jgi:type I restriction enzyme, S subunit
VPRVRASLSGAKGRSAPLHYIETDYWPHDTTLWCTDFLGNIPKFVYFRLHRLDLKKLDSGAANPALNRNFLHEELISWPPIDEQSEIVAILDTLDFKIDLHQRKLALLGDLFKALLRKLMTGEIRVSDFDLSALGKPPLEGAAA